jgi:hypothetical protein
LPYVPVPKDLTKVKTKLIFNLTKRQLICFPAAAAVGLPVYFLTRGAIGDTASALIMIVLMLPFFLLAMYERDGQSAEVILMNMLRCRRGPTSRPYRTENLYSTLTVKEDTYLAEKDKTAGTGRKAPAGKHQKL